MKQKTIIVKRLTAYPVGERDDKLKTYVEKCLMEHKTAYVVENVKVKNDCLMYELCKPNEKFDRFFGAVPLLYGHTLERVKEFTVRNLEMAVFEFELQTKV